MTKKTVRAIIKNSKGEILLIERHKQNRHYFVLPGGHIDQGENPKDALVREILEETGLKVNIKKLVRSETDKLGNFQSIYQCQDIDGTPTLSKSSIEARMMNSGQQSWEPKWFNPLELKNKTVYPEWLLEQILLI